MASKDIKDYQKFSISTRDSGGGRTQYMIRGVKSGGQGSVKLSDWLGQSSVEQILNNQVQGIDTKALFSQALKRGQTLDFEAPSTAKANLSPSMVPQMPATQPSNLQALSIAASSGALNAQTAGQYPGTPITSTLPGETPQALTQRIEQANKPQTQGVQANMTPQQALANFQSGAWSSDQYNQYAAQVVSGGQQIQTTSDERDANGLLINPPGALFDRSTGKPLPQAQTPQGEAISPPVSTPTASPPSAPAPVVVTSEAERAKERIQAIKDSLGLGERPTSPTLTTPEDKTRLSTAQADRATLMKESEDILAEKLKLDEEFSKFSSQQGKEMTEAGRTGAISEEERNYQFRRSAIERRELIVETKLNNRNNTIRDIMSMQQTDFANATSAYDAQYTKAIQLYNLLDKDEDEIKTNAKANLDVYSNMFKAQIESGQFNAANITGIQKSKLEELELQAGLPQGSTLAVLSTLKPNEEILYKNVDDQGNFNIVTKDANGKITTKRISGVETTGAGVTGTQIDIARKFVADNSTASREELELELRKRLTKLTDSDVKLVLDEAEKKKPALTIDQIKTKIVNVLNKQKDVFTRSEAKTAAETQLKTSLGLSKDQSLPQAYKDAIEDGLVEVYGKTFWQSVLPGGR